MFEWKREWIDFIEEKFWIMDKVLYMDPIQID